MPEHKTDAVFALADQFFMLIEQEPDSNDALNELIENCRGSVTPRTELADGLREWAEHLLLELDEDGANERLNPFQFGILQTVINCIDWHWCAIYYLSRTR